MNSLVDTYKDRYFDPRRGQVIGENYGPSGQPIESELGLGSGKRMAGSALALAPTDLTADGNVLLRQLLKFGEGETDPGRLYREQEKQNRLRELFQSTTHDIAHGGSTPYKPMDRGSLKKLSEPGSPMPPGMKEKILLELREMLRKA